MDLTSINNNKNKRIYWISVLKKYRYVSDNFVSHKIHPIPKVMTMVMESLYLTGLNPKQCIWKGGNIRIQLYFGKDHNLIVSHDISLINDISNLQKYIWEKSMSG